MSKREIPQVITDLQAIGDRLTNPEAWNKGLFGNKEGPNCLVGAMDIIIDRDYNFLKEGGEGIRQLKQAAERRLNTRDALSDCLSLLHRGHNSITQYNDAPETTHENILYLIDRALKSEKKKACIIEMVV